MTSRTLPMPIQRQLLVEAGHRCAIPTCREPRIEFAHIIPWEEVLEHKFENMICLCPTHHSQYDDPNEKKLDRKCILMYKANLCVLNNRYSSVEKRVLEIMAQNNKNEFVDSFASKIHLAYLIKDGLFEIIEEVPLVQIGKYYEGQIIYRVTPIGEEFLDNMRNGRSVDVEFQSSVHVHTSAKAEIEVKSKD